VKPFEPDTVAELSALIDHSTDIITVLDDEGAVLYQSPPARDILGWEQAELAGESAFEYVHPDDRNRVWDLFQEMVDSPTEQTQAVEFRFQHADGSWVWLESVGANHQHSAVDGYVINSRDVTQRRRLERRFRHFVRHSTDIINVIDEAGINRYVSPSVERVLGYTPAEQTGVSPFDYMHPDDVADVLAEFQRGLSEPGYTTTVEFRFEHADGHWVWLETRGQSLPDDPILEGSVVVNSRDVTERRETEATLRRKNEQLEAITSVVSHDLRSPLSVASGHLELAREDHGSEHLERVAAAHDRIESYIDDLLTAAGQGVDLGEKTAVALRPVSARAWESVATGAATLENEAERTVLADEHRLTQLLENLFRNAIDHAGSAPTVTVGDLPEGFFVADDGPGIPQADREAVFDVGRTDDDGGTGLGLYIVDAIATAHGWDLLLTESDTGGARFEFTHVTHPDE
jgi:PAS domain S-box-containing protein